MLMPQCEWMASWSHMVRCLMDRWLHAALARLSGFAGASAGLCAVRALLRCTDSLLQGLVYQFDSITLFTSRTFIR